MTGDRKRLQMCGWALLTASLLLVISCRRESGTKDVSPQDAGAPSSPIGTPAQAVLVAPDGSEMVVDVKAQALGVPTAPGKPRGHVSLTEERDKGVFHITLQDPRAEMYDTGDGMVVRLQGGGAHREPGSPDIGGLVWILPGKAGWNLMPSVTDVAFATATQRVDVAAVPVRKDASDDPTGMPVIERNRSRDIYELNEFFPSHVVRVQEAWVGTNKMVRLIVNPIQYNPVTKELRLCYRLNADLKYVKAADPES